MDDGAAPHGQQVVGAVALSGSCTAPFVTVTAVRRTAWDRGRNAVIHVSSVWDIISYHTALSYPAPTLVTTHDDDPPDYVQVSWTVLGVAAGVAVLGEVLEFVLGAAGSRRAGGSTRAAVLAILGSLVGGLLGTALPVPIVGTLSGACLGAFIGSLIGDLWAGRPLFRSFEAGWGAAMGRFWGTVSKLTVGGIIVVILALAAFF